MLALFRRTSIPRKERCFARASGSRSWRRSSTFRRSSAPRCCSPTCSAGPRRRSRRLDTTVAAVNSALQRARAMLAARDLGDARGSLSDAQAELLDRYVAAFERYDVDALTALLHEDVTLSMPPYTLWLRGRDPDPRVAPGTRLGLSRVAAHPDRRVRLARVRAVPACGAGWSRGVGLIVLELAGDRISGWTSFLDTESLFPRFGLPLELPR